MSVLIQFAKMFSVMISYLYDYPLTFLLLPACHVLLHRLQQRNICLAFILAYIYIRYN